MSFDDLGHGRQDDGDVGHEVVLSFAREIGLRG